MQLWIKPQDGIPWGSGRVRVSHGMPSVGLGLWRGGRLPSLTGFLSLTIIPRSPGIVGAKHLKYINLRRGNADAQATGKDAVLGLRRIRGVCANHRCAMPSQR